MNKEFIKAINDKVILDNNLSTLSSEVFESIKRIYLTLKKGSTLCGNEAQQQMHNIFLQNF